MSPRIRCLTSSLVRRPGRTGPATGRTGESPAPEIDGPGCCREPEGLGRVAAIAARVTPAGLGCTLCARSGGAAQIARVAARGAVVVVRPEHPHQLADHLALAELDDRGQR